MTRLKTLALAAALFAANLANAQDDLINKVKDQGAEGSAGYQFTTLVDLEATPVKNQGRSETCWSYATSSFVESEMLRMGKKPIDLSEMFTVRQVYKDKAERYVRLHGHLNFAQGGALPDVLYVMKKYGAVPAEAFQGLNYGTDHNNHGELEAVLKGMLDAVIANKNGKLTPVWKEAVDAVLDVYLGKVPQEFKYEGKTYTPRTFADKVVGLNPDDYVQITSFTHYPFYEQVQIMVPDNWNWGPSFNLPLDEMMEVLNNSLDKGYSVAWATDVSEKGFSLKNGLAIVPDEAGTLTASANNAYVSPVKQKKITQEMRQEAYDNYETTDDHGMLINGKMKAQDGTIYYQVKNSWGDRENPYRTGYIMASDAFVRYKTISLLLHKDALPKNIRKKLNL